MHSRTVGGCAGFATKLILTFLVVCGVCGSAATRPSRTRSPLSLGEDYVSALATANRFLHAWQSRDHETAILLLTDTAKQHCSEDCLEAFLSSDPRGAYEIGRGRKLRTGRYAFPVTIFAASVGGRRAFARPRYTELIVGRAGKHDWAVDRVP